MNSIINKDDLSIQKYTESYDNIMIIINNNK